MCGCACVQVHVHSTHRYVETVLNSGVIFLKAIHLVFWDNTSHWDPGFLELQVQPTSLSICFVLTYGLWGPNSVPYTYIVSTVLTRLWPKLCFLFIFIFQNSVSYSIDTASLRQCCQEQTGTWFKRHKFLECPHPRKSSYKILTETFLGRNVYLPAQGGQVFLPPSPLPRPHHRTTPTPSGQKLAPGQWRKC